MKLSKRLLEVAKLVTKGMVVADIGTDHGYVPIYLVENNICSKAYAMDINKGPIQKAKENIINNNLESLIETRLSDGLEKLEIGEANSIVISGIGGELMISILKNGKNVIETIDELIISPHSEISLVRKYLTEINFQIVDETMLKEDGKFYTIIKAVPGKTNNYSQVECCYGPILLRNRDKALYEYLILENNKNKKLLETLDGKGTDNSSKRAEEIKDILKLIENAIDYY